MILPETWCNTTLDFIRCDKKTSVNPSKNPNQNYELYSIPSHESLKPEIALGKEIGSSKISVEPNTVLLGKINPRINRVWIVGNFTIHQKIASTEWIPFFPLDGILPHYLSYYLQTNTLRDFLAHNVSGVGGSLMRIKPTTLNGYDFPLPPLPEQHRIVAKIEELFSDLDAGIASLKKVKEQLKTYRQSVLKWAFEGKLTEEWRKKHKSLFRTFSAFIQKHANKQLSLNPDILREYNSVDNIPDEWVLKRIGNVFNVFVGSTPSRGMPTFWNGEIPWVSSGEVAFCRIKDTREKISTAGYKNSSTKLHPIGTVLIGMIGEGKTRGQSAILDIEACNNQNSAAIRVSEIGFPPEFIYYYLVYRYEESRKLGSGNNQPALNKSRVQAIPIPITNVEEQNAIVSAIESRLFLADNLEKTIDAALSQSDALRQSILKRAFEGKLVPQDPNDEPAAKLLERIKAEREKITEKKRSRK
ncbi:MAG: restriction endonuclease subunit S [Chitinispirillaceae bacterium]|nr:restriction endonuclease subunit S [Chitinispirillaceae bacterium]